MIKKQKSPCHCINLRRATGSITDIYDKFLLPVNLSVNQYSIIINLSRLKQSSITELANFIGLERTSLTRALKPLIERAIIEDISENAKREKKIQLSNYGDKILSEATPLWNDAQATIEKKLGKEKLEKLYEILDLLRE